MKAYVSAEYSISMSNRLKNALVKIDTIHSFKTSNKLSSLVINCRKHTLKNEEK